MPISFSVNKVDARQRGEDDLSEWLYKFRGRSGCHVTEVAYCPRATLPPGQCSLASGRRLIYKQSNLIFSVWTVCNLVLERNPSKSSVVLVDNYVALSCPASESRYSHIPGRFTFFFSLGAISNQHLGDSNLERQGSSSNSTYVKLCLVQGSRTF